MENQPNFIEIIRIAIFGRLDDLMFRYTSKFLTHTLQLPYSNVIVK